MKTPTKRLFTGILCITLILMHVNGRSQTVDRLSKDRARTASENQKSIQLKKELQEKHRFHTPPMRALARPVIPTTAILPPVNTADSLALVALYNSTNGPAWTNSTNWLTQPVYDWYGITVTGDRVTGIDLHNNNLVGPITSDIGNLTALQILLLYENSLSGSIPSALGSCSALMDLDLYYNNLTGSIPSALGSLNNLLFLYLDDNYLTGSVPSSFGSLTSLIELDISWNYLDGTIPTELGSLGNLEYLSLWENRLTGTIPSSLGNLNNLMWLDLEVNNLTGGIPTSLGNCSFLIFLDLGMNSLTGSIPADLGKLSGLVILYLGYNHLEGSIPSALGGYPALLFLGLGHNRLSGAIPEALASLPTLMAMDLAGNMLQGAISSAFMSSNLATNNTDFRYNALYSNDAILTSYLDIIQIGGDWQSTQTIAPAAVHCQNQSATTVQLWWPVIPYTGNSGGYRVSYATNINGPFTLYGITSDKNLGGMRIVGLTPGTQYFFRIYTSTYPHDHNQNTVISGSSPVATITAGWNLPEINVSAGEMLLNGGTLDMGHQEIASAKDLELTIFNDGLADLSLALPLTISGPDSAQFTLLVQPDTDLLPKGDSTTTVIRFLSLDAGEKEAVVSIISNDNDENPFTVVLHAVADNHSLTIAHAPEQAGVTDPVPGLYEYGHNEVVSLTATPAQGWEFLRWDGGGVNAPTSASASVTMDTSYQITAVFGRIGNSYGPFLSYRFPIDSAASVPRNARIQFMAADSGEGVDLGTLDCWINDESVISGGIPETDTTVTITEAGPHYRITYIPAHYYPADSTVEVRVRFSETGQPGSVCDSTWIFFTGAALLDTATVSGHTAGPEGGTISNESLGVTISLPEDALIDTVEISIGLAENLPPLPAGYRGIGLDYYFGPDGLEFAHDIMVAIPYTQEDLDEAGVASALDLIVNYYHSADGEWRELVVNHVDEALHLLYVTMNEFCFLTFCTAATGVEEQTNRYQPQDCTLEPPYPNPFNPETRIEYHIAHQGPVELSVYDLLGRTIKTLVNRTESAGAHVTWWDGRDSSGRKAASGTYLIILKSGAQREMQKAVLLQ